MLICTIWLQHQEFNLDPVPRHTVCSCLLSVVALLLKCCWSSIVATAPPRALHCEFPLGRPLGNPNEPEFQRKVITAAFSLLEMPSGPVLVDYPISIDDDADTPLSCPIPPIDTSGRNPAAAEAL